MKPDIESCVQLQPSAEGVLTVWIDTPQRSVNVFDAAMVAALEAAVEQIAQGPIATRLGESSDIKQASPVEQIANSAQPWSVVLFRSRKAGCFFAGADVHAITQLTSPAQAEEILQRGQQLMQRVADLPMTTVAFIDGICMGGGLEFAMACDYRVASTASHTKLSLPEIRLGLIPGWGGTQRLPKLVGLQQALKMILRGSSLTADKARRAGLVDGVFNPDQSQPKLSEWTVQWREGRFRRTSPKRHWTTRWLESNGLGRKLILSLARRGVRSQSQHYPALLQALQAVGLAYDRHRDGYQVEREAFAKLLFTPTARSLLGLFEQRDRAKKISSWLSPAATTPPSNRSGRLAVIGAGQMGAAIGVLAARQGIDVLFKEIDDSAARAGAERVKQLLEKQAAGGRMSAAEQQQARGRCDFTSRWQDLENCEMAIEAVLEVDSIKHEVFQQLDRSLPSQAVLLSNTSSLSVTRMATATTRRQQVAGLHFFHPVDRMELVEVVRTEMTDEPTVQRLLELVKRLGKTPIVTSDKPGFLVNRVLFPYLGEAVRMVAEGYDVATIDRELKHFGMPMGPLELIDQVGIDIASHVAQSLASVQSDAEVPAKFLADMAARHWLGKKSKCGFYIWDKKRTPNSELARGKSPAGLSAARRSAVGSSNSKISTGKPAARSLDEFEPDGLSAIQRRLVYPMLNEAVNCLDEAVVAEPWMVDLGMVLGTGFAPMRGGPLRTIDLLGTAVVLRNMKALERSFGKRFAAADGLVARATRQLPFFPVGVSESLNWESKDESRCTTES